MEPVRAAAGGGVAAPALARPRRRARDLVGDVGLPLAVLVLFGVSGGMLWLIGYNYDGLTGSPLTKIHPFTYMVVALFCWRALASGDPVGTVLRAIDRRPAAALMALMGVVALAVTVLRKGPGMAGFVDTFVGPALLVALMADAGARATARIALTLHLVMGINAVMALYEFATHRLVFPYRFDGAVFPFDLRSSALQGHPLVNASVTSCYVLALLNGGYGLSRSLRLAIVALQCAALVTFGGRSGLVVTMVMGGGYLAVAAFQSLRQRREPLLGAALGVVLLTAVPVVLVGVGTTGFFDAALLRFQSDGGSANARVEMLDLVRALPLRELLIGPDVAWVESMRRINGLEWGIENPVIRLMLYQGAVLTALLLGAFLLFMIELARRGGRGVWLPIVATLILLNTAESIGGKTTVLAKVAVIAMCLYPPGEPRRDGLPRRPVSPAAS